MQQLDFINETWIIYPYRRTFELLERNEIMIKITVLVLIMFFLSSCSSLLYNFHKIQSDDRLRKTEVRNLLDEKALTQWWYFDFFFDDGSVLVLMFVPHHWWTDPEKEPDAKTLIYVSYMTANGELIKAEKVIDSNEVHYDENGLKSPYLEIIRSHQKKTREYTINFFLDEIKGTAKIVSNSKDFSPLPTGSLKAFGTKFILGKKGKGLQYRYAAHIPQGKVTCKLDINDNYISLSGKAYHEQGWFTGQPHQMGDGWVWFHFVSQNINIFGAKTFLYLEMDGQVIIGGLNSFNRRCVLSDSIFANKPSNLLVGGKFSFNSSNSSFDIIPIGKKSTTLVCIPSKDTDQIWGTVLQPSIITIQYHGKEFKAEGLLLLETSKMSR